MKYKVATTIHKPLNEVMKEFRNLEAAFNWMENLVGFNLIEGEMDKEGSSYELTFQKKDKITKMKETLLKVEKDVITTKYEMNNVENICINKFKEDRGNTIYLMDTSFSFPVPLNILMPLFKPLFKRQSKKGIDAFRDYVEREKIDQN